MFRNNLCQEKLGGSYGSLPKDFWSPLDLGFIKLNLDTNFQSDSRTSTRAVLARDPKGEIIRVETYLFEDVVNAFVVEARACERSLLFTLKMGFLCLIMERDSLTVIKKLKTKEEDISVLRPIIHHIRDLESCFEEVDYFFVPQLVNGAAHTLAIEGKRKQSSGIWVDGILVSVRILVEKDQVGWTQRHQRSL
ncbi:hypothetical protein J1N35_009872 [Gossypium stocksii]|uniref:RNase H type-1 domain-containing protein n=1 Tax=Gossypium stocksii TaxID=47602 RepID=A0A9D3VZF6_9ROSI|nr:hypothetical protein J1N35_009872 [Gossypium stocksii]